MVTKSESSTSSNPALAQTPAGGDVQIEEVKKEFSEFGLYENNGYTLIRMNQQLTPAAFASLEKKTEFGENQTPRHFVIDCSAMVDLNADWIRFCLQLKKRIEEKQKKIRMINVNIMLMGKIKQRGLSGSLQISSNLNAALADVGLRSGGNSFDVELVNPFLTSAINVVKSFSDCESRQNKTFTRPGGAPFSAELAGVLLMECAGFRALFVICFPKDTIYKIAGKMVGSEINEVNGIVLSAVGEIGNIIYSQGRKVLNEKGHGLQTALPKVFSEPVFPVEFSAFQGLNIVVPFETDIGNYFAEIRL